MRINGLFAALAALLLLGACAQKPAPAMDTSAADADAIRALALSFVDAWNAADTAAYTAMLADDIVEMPQGLPARSNRDAIVEWMAGAYDSKVVRQIATVDEVVVYGDYANAWGTWRLNPITPTGAEGESPNGKWMTLYKRNASGQWQYWRWIWNQNEGTPVPTG